MKKLILNVIVFPCIVIAVYFLWTSSASEYKQKIKEGSQINFQIGDDRAEISFGGVQWGFVTEIKDFGADYSQKIRAVKVKVKVGNSDQVVELPAYVLDTEDIHVGERVVVHNLSVKDTRGFNYTAIITKDKETAPAW